MAAAAPAGGVGSPCISLCRIHAGSGWCEGCLRTLDEIVGWGRLDDANRTAILQRLPPRRVAWRAIKAAAAANACTSVPSSAPTPAQPPAADGGAA